MSSKGSSRCPASPSSGPVIGDSRLTGPLDGDYDQYVVKAHPSLGSATDSLVAPRRRTTVLKKSSYDQLGIVATRSVEHVSTFAKAGVNGAKAATNAIVKKCKKIGRLLGTYWSDR